MKPKLKQVILADDYLPSESEQYMNEFHIEYFRNKLCNTRQILQEEWENLNDEIHSSGNSDSELSDKASHEIIIFSSIKRLSSIQNSKLIRGHMAFHRRQPELGCYGVLRH